MKHLLYVVILLAGLVAIPNNSKADSVICNGVVYVETSTNETFNENFINTMRIDYVYRWIRIYPWALMDKGSKNSLQDNGRVSYPNEHCVFVSDTVDSTDNLSWYMNLLSTINR